MFIFTNLQTLHQDMIKKDESRVTFNFKYNKKTFSCIFLFDVTPFRLYLTTLGTNPIVLELEISKGYKANTFLDDYNNLVDYLELKYDAEHKFSTNDFFNFLNSSIPKEFTHRPSYTDVLTTASHRRKIEDINKIYFCGWYQNPIGHTVRAENLEKTRSAFGSKIAELSELNNISSCWTDVANDEQLNKINDLLSV